MKSQLLNKRILICLIFCYNFCLTPVFSQSKKYNLSNAHSHNDYHHPIPFYTAYHSGFGSIEADIILKDGKLFVAHDQIEIHPKKILSSLYLNPLQRIIKKNSGYVYADSLKQLVLLVDIKTDAVSTLDTLLQVLKRYPTITNCPTLKIVISGNQPDVSSLASYPDYIFFDGRLHLNYTEKELDKVFMFSGNFLSYSSWKGEGIPDTTDIVKIRKAVSKAHGLNKPLRFWATPDNPQAWKLLMDLEVDFINTDKIREMTRFLLGRTIK